MMQYSEYRSVSSIKNMMIIINFIIILFEASIILFSTKYVCNNFVTDNKYAVRQNTFFSIRDQNNCKRIYQAIREL